MRDLKIHSKLFSKHRVFFCTTKPNCAKTGNATYDDIFCRQDCNKVLCVFLFEKADTIFAPDLDSVHQVTQHVNSFSTGNTHDMPRSGNFLLGLKALHDGFLPQPQWKKD